MTRIATWLGLLPADIADLPAAGHARLMDTVYHRIRTSMAVMSLVYLPFLWAASERLDDTAVRLWFGFYLLFMLAGWGPYLLYRRDSARMDAETRLRVWGKRINGIALLHGAGLSASVPLAAGLSDLAYLALLAIALGHIASVMGRVAGFNANRGHVLRYIAIGINPATLLLPWVFPGQWMFMLPLSIVYAMVIYRTTHSLFEFMVRQIRLEQESQPRCTRQRRNVRKRPCARRTCSSAPPATTCDNRSMRCRCWWRPSTGATRTRRWHRCWPTCAAAWVR